MKVHHGPYLFFVFLSKRLKLRKQSYEFEQQNNSHIQFCSKGNSFVCDFTYKTITNKYVL